MYKTRICLKPIGLGMYVMVEQPEGYTIQKDFMGCYNSWADVSHGFYEKWNKEFDSLHPELEGMCLIDNQEYMEFIEPRMVAAWNKINRGKLVLIRWDMENDDWYYRKATIFEKIRA